MTNYLYHVIRNKLFNIYIKKVWCLKNNIHLLPPYVNRENHKFVAAIALVFYPPNVYSKKCADQLIKAN